MPLFGFMKLKEKAKSDPGKDSLKSLASNISELSKMVAEVGKRDLVSGLTTKSGSIQQLIEVGQFSEAASQIESIRDQLFDLQDQSSSGSLHYLPDAKHGAASIKAKIDSSLESLAKVENHVLDNVNNISKPKK